MWVGYVHLYFEEFNRKIYVFRMILKFREVLGEKLRLSFPL